jgi:heavy metal-binding protein
MPGSISNGGRTARRLRLSLLIASTAFTFALAALDSAAHFGTPGVTWTGTVSPVLERGCITCHSAAGGVQPALDGSENARGAAQLVKHAVITRRMPRWHAVSGFGDFANDPSLTAAESQHLADWADAGAPYGEAAAPPGRTVQPSDAVAPDLLLRLSSKHLIRTAAHTFDLPTGLNSDRWIRGWAFRAGNPSLVRGAVIALASGATLATWVPGESATFLPAGVARRLPAGSTLRVTVYYRVPEGPAVDASSLGLYFSAHAYRELSHQVVPCGVTRLTRSIDVLAIRPAPASNGQSLAVVARNPNGAIEPLGWFRQYSDDHPQTYWFAHPLALATGASVDVSAIHGSCGVELDYVLPADRAAAANGMDHGAHAAHGIRPRDVAEPGFAGYRCPMHPEIRSETPGTCPQCRMTLMPMSARIRGAYRTIGTISGGSGVNRSPTAIEALTDDIERGGR